MWSQTRGEGGDGALAARWVRRRYYVHGDYIKPLPEGQGEAYDPFDSYYGADSARPERSLYQELVDLDLSRERAVEEFTTTWGLLGLFQHRLLQRSYVLSNPPLSEIGNGVPEWLIEWSESPGSAPVWTLAVSELLSESKPADPAERRAVMDQWRARRPFPEGWVLIETPEGFYEPAPREEYARPYFPDVPKPVLTEDQVRLGLEFVAENRLSDEAFELIHFIADDGNQFPSLGSAGMWARMCEPLAEFRAAVEELHDVYALCADRTERGSVAVALTICTRHLRRVHPIPHQADDGKWTWRWSFPSLLSAAYTMLFLDFVVEKRKLCFCAECGKSMVADRADKKYCGRTCQNRANQRRWRERSANASDEQEPKKGDSR